jgi:hypothetical protein
MNRIEDVVFGNSNDPTVVSMFQFDDEFIEEGCNRTRTYGIDDVVGETMNLCWLHDPATVMDSEGWFFKIPERGSSVISVQYFVHGYLNEDWSEYTYLEFLELIDKHKEYITSSSTLELLKYVLERMERMVGAIPLS